MGGAGETTRRRVRADGATDFVRCFPRAAIPARSSDTVPVPHFAPASGQILLVTGDGRDEDGLATLLRAAGYTVRVSAPESPTFHESIANPPGLLLAVVNVASENGLVLAFARRLREALGGFAPALVVIAGGGDDDEESLERAFVAGARDVLARPVHPSLLRVKVAQYIRSVAWQRTCVGSYAVRKTLGRGANGVVYLAERDGAPIALKVIDAQAVEADPESLARFRRETEALRRLSCDGIPRFFDAGRERDLFYCAMEFVPGDTLDAILDDGPLPEGAVLGLLLELARALLAVHEVGLVHRDVKPANVILTPSGRAKLVDFGLAKEPQDSSLTRGDEIVGTVAYMAPELALGKRASAASDAYALGMTGLHAAIGYCPLSGTSWEILGRVSRGDIPSPSALLPQADARLVGILEGLLRADPLERALLEEVVARLT
ncbi:protein kinase [bacterium]|nr:protein kinase [bacterium]